MASFVYFSFFFFFLFRIHYHFNDQTTRSLKPNGDINFIYDNRDFVKSIIKFSNGEGKPAY